MMQNQEILNSSAESLAPLQKKKLGSQIIAWTVC